MLTQVDVVGSRFREPVLSLGGFYPNQNPIRIRDISGLGPVEANIITADSVHDGVLYQGSNIGKRNIVLKLGLNPIRADQTMSSLRQMLYRYFLPKAWCKFRFYSDDMPTVEIEGYVEDFEPNIFSKDPEIQISVICPQPDFVGIDRQTYTGVDIPETIQMFTYDGTVDTGFEINIDMIAPINNSVAKNGTVITETQHQRIRVGPAGGFYSNFQTLLVGASNHYYLRLSTMKNRKKIEYVRRSDGLVINQLANKVKDTSWPLIRPGINYLGVHRYKSRVETQVPKNWTLWFYNRYGGL
jgi:hypothetical protein